MALVVAASGCANIGLGPPVVVGRQQGRVRQEMVTTEGVAATAKLDKTILTVTVGAACVRRGVRTTTITETRDNVNNSSGVDWFLAGTGAVALGTGAVLVADAPGTYPNDTSSRQYNPTGPGTERALGVGLIVLGAIVTGIAGYDAISASGSETTKRTVEEPQEAKGKPFPCDSYPKAGYGILLKAKDAEITIGKTDNKGILRVDLVDALPPTSQLPTRRTMTVMVAGSDVATIDIGAVLVAREDAAWKRLSLPACQQPSSSSGCSAVEAFLAEYPDGAHAKEAQNLLVASRPKLAVLADDEAWAAAGGEYCADPKATNLDVLEAACSRVDGYILNHPGGGHVAEAKKALKVGEPRLARLRADEKRAEENAEAEKKRAEAEAKRKVEAEARAEAAKERARCVGECQVLCSSRGFRDPISCVNGCIASKCNP
jgi:predicted cobalt transporter CbtA